MTQEQESELSELKAALKQHIVEADKSTTGPWDYEGFGMKGGDEVSDTPITDANVCMTTREGCETIAPDTCRKFERENAAMREAIRVAHKMLQVCEFNGGSKGMICQECFQHISKGHKPSCYHSFAISKLQPFLKP